MGGGWEIINKQGVRAFLRQANLKHGNRESTTCPSFFLDRDVRHQLRLTFNNNPGRLRRPSFRRQQEDKLQSASMIANHYPRSRTTSSLSAKRQEIIETLSTRPSIPIPLGDSSLHRETSAFRMPKQTQSAPRSTWRKLLQSNQTEPKSDTAVSQTTAKGVRFVSYG